MSILTRAASQFQFMASKLFRGITWDSEVERYLEFEGLCKIERPHPMIIASQFGILISPERKYVIKR